MPVLSWRSERRRAECAMSHGNFGPDGSRYKRLLSTRSRAAARRYPNGIPPHPGVQPLDLLRIIIAIILPPLGVFLQEGIGKHFWINILLTLLGYIPGIVHAVWIIARR